MKQVDKILKTEVRWENSLQTAKAYLKNRVKRISPLYNWQKDSEDKLKGFLVFCLLTPGSRIENLKKILSVIRTNPRVIEDKDMLFEVIKEFKVRFPNKKFRLVKELLRKKVKIKETLTALSSLREQGIKGERQVRDTLMDEIRGFGLKTCSLFLMDISFCKNLAILDSRNLNFMEKVKLIPNGLQLNKKIYTVLEDWENDLSRMLGIDMRSLDYTIVNYKYGYKRLV